MKDNQLNIKSLKRKILIQIKDNKKTKFKCTEYKITNIVVSGRLFLKGVFSSEQIMFLTNQPKFILISSTGLKYAIKFVCELKGHNALMKRRKGVLTIWGGNNFILSGCKNRKEIEFVLDNLIKKLNTYFPNLLYKNDN